jgi:shikimate kinase
MIKNIILIGFMGTGKSTVGKSLAAELGWEFVDTDAKIEEMAGKSIPRLFSEDGEERFRDLESEALRLVTSGQRQVIATGGGVVLRPANRQLMLENGLVVALQADADTIIGRVRGDANRPLLAGDAAEKVHRLMRERAGAYDFAPVQIDTKNREVAEIVRLIKAYVK